MITFDVGPVRFSYRTVAVCLHDGYVFAEQADHEDFWSLPGGRVAVSETAEEAVRREMREELGLEPRIERLLWVVENLFTHEGRAGHEIGLYYLVSFDAEAEVYDRSRNLRCLDVPELRLAWLPVVSLEETRLVPRFLRTHLRALPATVAHIVNRDDGT